MAPWRNNRIQPLRWMLRAALLAAALGLANLPAGASQAAPSSSPAQTDVDRAEHVFDSEGVPILRIKNVGDVRNPATVAAYYLMYAGVKTYGTVVAPDDAKAAACARWLAANLKPTARGDLVWLYPFDNTYNDVTVKAPWYSAFGQAVGIEALVHSRQAGGPRENLDLARQAAEVLLRPVRDGGLMYQKGDDVWYEEVAVPADNPPHILNGHMRALLSLKLLADATGDAKYKKAFERGLATLVRWLPLYDSGYWLKYDLNPRKSELLFRLNNPYGEDLPPLAVDRISICDARTGQEVALDVGSAGDGEGDLRIAGNDWGQPTTLDGRGVRRLAPVRPATRQEELDGGFRAPGTYFYLKLPDKWADNLRTDWLELVIDYKDERPGNLAVQMRSIGPGVAFRDLRDGDLLLSGSGAWRKWRIPVRPSDLGHWVGAVYAEKHAQYLRQLCRDEPRLKPWALLAEGYLSAGGAPALDGVTFVTHRPISLPTQCPMVLFSYDEASGLLVQHQALPETRLVEGLPLCRSTSDGRVLDTPVGAGIVNPHGVAHQLLKGPDYVASNMQEYFQSKSYPLGYRFDPKKIAREPAFKWLTEAKNQQAGKFKGIDFVTWPARFPSAYNDVATAAPWASAFSQAGILQALLAEGTKLDKAKSMELLRLGLNAYLVPVSAGGLSDFTPEGGVFFEEVPNATHILNAHLLTLNVLREIQSSNALTDKGAGQAVAKTLAETSARAIASLREQMHVFDCGYWLKYDANPRKEFLLQIDWRSGEKSPLIGQIVIENPQTHAATRIEAGSGDAFEGAARISGTDWMTSARIDGTSVRSFRNGYRVRQTPVEKATRHNVYIVARLPEDKSDDWFRLGVHRLIVRYKDVAEGEFAFKIQAINEGSRLVFAPLRGGLLKCTGDGKWKQAVFELRPADLGWYVGPEYQVYHLEQLNQLGRERGDWFFQQCAARQEYFLDAHKKGRPTIIESSGAAEKLQDLAPAAKVVSATTMYAGHEVANALDGEAEKNYVAAVESPLPHEFELDLGAPADVRKIVLVWESEENYATEYDVESVDADGATTPLATIKDAAGKKQEIDWPQGSEVRRLKFVVRATHGQARLLLRQVKIIGNMSEQAASKSASASAPAH